MVKKQVLLILANIILFLGCGQEPQPHSQIQFVPPTYDHSPSAVVGPSVNADNEEPKYYLDFLHDRATEKSIAEKKAAFPYTEIQLERTSCFGSCPSYSVTLHADGTAEYVGRKFAPKTGKFTGKIYAADYVQLCWAIEKFKLLQGPRSFSEIVIDAPATILRVRKRGTEISTEITTYMMEGPVELWAIQNVIDGLVGQIKWEPIAP